MVVPLFHHFESCIW